MSEHVWRELRELPKERGPRYTHRWVAMSHILHRQLQHALPVAASASGVMVTDTEGRTYIDASGGAAVSCLGHSHPDVLAAMHAQIDRVAYVHTSFFTTQVAEELAPSTASVGTMCSSHRRSSSAMTSWT